MHSVQHPNLNCSTVMRRELLAGARLLARHCSRNSREALCSAASSGVQPASSSFGTQALRVSQLAVGRGEQARRGLSTTAAAAAAEVEDAALPSTSYGAQQIQVRRGEVFQVKSMQASLAAGLAPCLGCRSSASPADHTAAPTPSAAAAAGAARAGAGAQAAGDVHRQYGAAGTAPPGV